MKKVLKVLFALALVLAPFASPAVAAANSLPINPGNYAAGEVGSLTAATITKYLYRPCGVTSPDDATFEFLFTPSGQIFRGVRYDELTRPIARPGTPATDTTPAILNVYGPTIPRIGDLAIGADGDPVLAAAINHSGAGSITGDMEDAVNLVVDTPANRTRLGINTSADICVVEADFSFAAEFVATAGWTAPGHFIFTVSEVANTNTLPFLDGFVEEMDYDTNTFELHVIVSQLANGNLEITGIYAWSIGDVPAGWDGSRELDDEDLSDLVEQTGKVEYIYFVNGFRRWTELTECPLIPDPENAGYYIVDPDCEPPYIPGCPIADPDYPDCDYVPILVCPDGDPDCDPVDVFPNALTVRKTVSGSQADHNQYFDFRLNITRHTLDLTDTGAPLTPVTGYVWTQVGTQWVRDTYPFVFTNPAYSFTLRHNQVLVFDQILIGTIVEVIETDAHGYTPSVNWIFGTNNGATTGTTQGGVATVHPEAAGIYNRISETVNEANFLNVLDSVPITGLIMNNLPLILIVIGGAGFVAMIVAGKNRRVYE